MVETKSRRIERRGKKGPVSLLSLRASEVVRTVVDHPSRLDELLNLLHDGSRLVRARAATTLARLSESHPRRLVRVFERLTESLSDESAYVRWHLVYSLGRIAPCIPSALPGLLKELLKRLEDENGVVRAISSLALQKIAASRPQAVLEYFKSQNSKIPTILAKALPCPGTAAKESGK